MIICVDCGQEKEHCAFGLCNTCHRRRWRQQNPEKDAANKRRYRQANPEKVAAYLRGYREKHKEELNANNRRYHAEYREKHNAGRRRRYEKHKERERANARRYYAEHKEERRAYNRAYVPLWRQENPEKVAAKNARRRAYKRAVPATLTAEQAEQLLAIGRAMYRTQALHLDHIVPVSKGGGTTMANIHAIPASLNQAKQDKLPQEVYGQLLLSSHKPREEKKDD